MISSFAERISDPEIRWSEWQVLQPSCILKQRVLFELLEGGQTFQWCRTDLHPQKNGESVACYWSGIVDGKLAGLRLDSGGGIQFCGVEGTSGPELAGALKKLLRLDEDHQAALKTLPLQQDEYLRNCVLSFPGLRILNQPIEKVILTFLCSSNKQIPQIKQMLRNLSLKLGCMVAPGWHEYPAWNVLAEAPQDVLQECKTGYRAKYITESARIISADPDYFPNLVSCDYLQAKQRLLKLPGVGEKVADCILLYGGGFYEAFPLDTWIIKSLQFRYGLGELNRTEMLKWAQKHFGKYAGIAQQYLFAYERDRRELVKRK